MLARYRKEPWWQTALDFTARRSGPFSNGPVVGGIMQDIDQHRPSDETPDPTTPPEVPPRRPEEEGLPEDDPDGEEIGAEAPLA
jgi:hypothetical protein